MFIDLLLGRISDLVYIHDALTRPGFAQCHAVNKTAFNIGSKTDKGSFEDPLHPLIQRDENDLF